MEQPKYPVTVSLLKEKPLRCLAHLDIMRALARALRRSGLPLYFTKGYNPRVKMSFSDAIKLGEEGVVEVRIFFSKPTTPAEVVDRLAPHLPEGLTIKEG